MNILLNQDELVKKLHPSNCTSYYHVSANKFLTFSVYTIMKRTHSFFSRARNPVGNKDIWHFEYFVLQRNPQPVNLNGFC